MKTLYLECNMGAAGDMLMAALLELHPDPADFIRRLNGLGIPGVRVAAAPAVKCGIRGTHVSVTVHAVSYTHLGRLPLAARPALMVTRSCSAMPTSTLLSGYSSKKEVIEPDPRESLQSTTMPGSRRTASFSTSQITCLFAGTLIQFPRFLHQLVAGQRRLFSGGHPVVPPGPVLHKDVYKRQFSPSG